jgi:mono/diheme cytochrome c family protein
MNFMKNSLFLMTAALVVAGSANAQSLPKGEGLETYESVCGACHGADIVIGSQGSRARWEEVVESMKNRGAYGSEADFKVVTDYLVRYYGNPINVNTAAEKDLVAELGLSEAAAANVVKARTAAKIADYAAFTKIAGVEAAKMDLLKSRLKF